MADSQLQQQRARARDAGYYPRAPHDEQGYDGDEGESPYGHGYEVAGTPVNDELGLAIHLASHDRRLSQIEQALGQISPNMQSLQGEITEERNDRVRTLLMMGGGVAVGFLLIGLLPHPLNEKSIAEKTKAAFLALAADYQASQMTAASAGIATGAASPAPPVTAAMLAPPPISPPATAPSPAPAATVAATAPITQSAPPPAAAMQRLPAVTPPPTQMAFSPNAALGARADAAMPQTGKAQKTQPKKERAGAMPAPPSLPIRVAQVFTPLQNRVRAHMAKNGEIIPADWQPMFDREARGDLKGKLQVAARFLKGEGAARDQDFAVQLIREAAEAGEKEAMMWLAYAWQAGNLGRVDLAQSVRWFEMAGKAGITKAYVELGQIYETGIDGAPDPETALGWYQRAAKAGDSQAAGAVARLMPRPALTQQASLQADPAPGTLIPRGTPLAAAVNTSATSSPARTANIAPHIAENVPIAPPPAEQGATMNVALQASNEVRGVQRMLKALGYRIDRLDGVAGPQTGAAIRSYQRSKMLPANGEVSPQLTDSLLNDMRYGG